MFIPYYFLYFVQVNNFIQAQNIPAIL